MSLLEKDRNMAEGVDKEAVAQTGKNVDDGNRYFQSSATNDASVMERLNNKREAAEKAALTIEEHRNQRKPVWEKLNNPGEMTVLKWRALQEQKGQETKLNRALQLAQLQWNEAKSRREERRQQRLQAEIPTEIPTEIPRTPFFDKLKNIGRTISEFLSAPNKEAERLRRFETQPHEQLKETFKESGKRLRGFSGFLKGLGAAVFAGGKEGLKTGTKTFFEKMKKNKSSAQNRRSGEPAPMPGSF